MKKKVAHFDRDKCVGCGACVNACLEGAVALVDGKAMLVKEDHCDGLGNCLPNCPVGAITFEERDIPPPLRTAANTTGITPTTATAPLATPAPAPSPASFSPRLSLRT